VSHAAVANRYGRALFELAVESGNVTGLVQDIVRFAQVYASSAELKSVLENPMVEAEKRALLLSALAERIGLSGLGLNAVRLLASRHRLRALPDIARKLGSLADQHAGLVRATVTTAAPMPESFFERLQVQLEASTKKRLVIERLQDPSLIGGVVTRIGDNTIDGSVRGRLSELERHLRSGSV
jgi:F-type H+-transporting ATPase subunit delta